MHFWMIVQSTSNIVRNTSKNDSARSSPKIKRKVWELDVISEIFISIGLIVHQAPVLTVHAIGHLIICFENTLDRLHFHFAIGHGYMGIEQVLSRCWFMRQTLLKDTPNCMIYTTIAVRFHKSHGRRCNVVRFCMNKNRFCCWCLFQINI